MILEEGTDEQLKRSIEDIFQPRVGDYWMEVNSMKTTTVRVGDEFHMPMLHEQHGTTKIQSVFRVTRIERDFIYTTDRIYERRVWRYLVREGVLVLAPGRVLGVSERLVPA